MSRKNERYVRFEDNIILKHRKEFGVVDIIGAQQELLQHGYDRSYWSIRERLKTLRRKQLILEKGDRRGNSVAVMCIETGRRYVSISDAARHNGLAGGNGIYNSCRDGRRKAAGFHWQFI